MRRARRRHSRTEARTDEARFDSSVPVRIRVAVLKAARVFASDWAAGGGRRACRRRHGALSAASGLPSAGARCVAAACRRRGACLAGRACCRRGPPAWPSRHRMTSIHALGFLSGEFPARLRVYVCIHVHGRDRVGHAIVAPGGRRVPVLGTIDCGRARLGCIAWQIPPCLHA
ncbi:hypothetical protein DF122_35945 [Burkholderia pseudomallei]|nr:hypothetical protein BOC35_14700 [Burkholderia pseudomallei]ARK57407.1 hypothetical protein BOC36_31530 [Burkholderia pseudomallei]ARK69563.1 hypothetical protein BOC38_22910 [Burkholderia pseudomallei]ARL13173.1 hypothetical protein BOC45_32275 [Burkholderia pseudomallei]ARL19643.1 hypothetical protein BOC46_30645 [Burkholderia pseudomallei]